MTTTPVSPVVAERAQGEANQVVTRPKGAEAVKAVAAGSLSDHRPRQRAAKAVWAVG